MIDLRRRTLVVGLIVTVLFSTLLARLGYLQLVRGDSFDVSAQEQLIKTVRIPTVRGEIFDRFGRPLVANRVIRIVTVDKSQLRRSDRVKVLTRLASVLGRSYSELDRKLDDPREDQKRPIPVARDVKESAVVYISEHADRFPAVGIDAAAVRTYRQTSLAAHVLGYMGRINANELVSLPEALDYDERDAIGRTGIERSFEEQLRGKPGRQQVKVDRLGQIVAELPEGRVAPIPGEDVYLTIDVDIQRLAEDALATGLQVVRRENDDRGRRYKAPAGAAVVLDLQDGSVVALASYPTYDPEDIVASGISRDLQDPRSHYPLNNRAIQGEYPPASTFKPFTAIAALAEDLISARSTYDDTGSFRLPGKCDGSKCVWRNSGETPHGRINVTSALSVSSDTFFFNLGYRFWTEAGHDKEAIQTVAKRLGLGQRSGIALPFEHIARIPNEKTKLALNKANKTVFPDPKWRTGDSMNTALGQGFTVVTPLQLAVAYAALASRGIVITPKIALEPASVAALRATQRRVQQRKAADDAAAIAEQDPSLTTLPAPTITLAGSVRVGSVPVEAVPVESVPAESVPVESVPVESVPVAPATIVGAPTTVSNESPAPGTPVVAKSRYDLPPVLMDPVMAGLRGAIADKAGTGYDAFVGFPLEEFPIYGKTGTAEVPPKQDNAVFAAFGPMPGPRYVVVVFMEESGFGGKIAAPVARRIFEGLFGLPLTAVRFVQQAPD